MLYLLLESQLVTVTPHCRSSRETLNVAIEHRADDDSVKRVSSSITPMRISWFTHENRDSPSHDMASFRVIQTHSTPVSRSDSDDAVEAE